MNLYLSLFTFVFAFYSQSLAATAPALCEPAQSVGQLDPKVINESSGMAFSHSYQRLYHINDSGDGPFFYVTNMTGGQAQRHRILGFKPRDVEALALAPCGSTTCLVIADIGDNLVRRKTLQIAWIEEREKWPAEITPKELWTFTYADGAHNAEAMLVHPSGDVFIFTKQMRGLERTSGPTKIYRLRRPKEGAVTNLKAEKVGELNLPELTGAVGQSNLVTDATWVDTPQKWALLTYGQLLQFHFDLSDSNFPKNLQPGKDFLISPCACSPNKRPSPIVPKNFHFTILRSAWRPGLAERWLVQIL